MADEDDAPPTVTEEVAETVAPGSVAESGHEQIIAAATRLEGVADRLVEVLSTVTAPPPGGTGDGEHGGSENDEPDETPVSVPWTHKRF